MFHQLANLPTDHSAIAKALTKRGKKFAAPPLDTREPQTMEGALPAAEAEPGTLKTTLAATPRTFVLLCHSFVFAVSLCHLQQQYSVWLLFLSLYVGEQDFNILIILIRKHCLTK